MENLLKDSINILEEIIFWWETWDNSSEPHNIEDPPIEEAKELLLRLKQI